MDVRILVIADHAMIAALLGALVELAGYRPAFADPGELPEAAVARMRPDLVLLDSDHPSASREALYRAAAASSSGLVLFGSTLNADETERFAAFRGAKWLSLPIGYHGFAERMREALGAPPMPVATPRGSGPAEVGTEARA
ncbi:MAG: hypothetical protein ACJ79S_12205 [Gemmatimonadaceae bacterium]